MGTGSMTGERIEIDLAAPPHRVYEAIATAAGVTSWWTDGDFAEAIGETRRLTFGNGWTELRIERLEPDRAVEWSCVGQDIEHFTPTDEWVGTRIRFDLSPLGDAEQTHLVFVHQGLAGLDCEEMCVKGWNHYVGVSLKELVETGSGRPGAGRGSA